MKENFVSSVIDHYQNEVLPDEKYSSLVFKNKLNKRWWKCKMTFVISIKKRLTCWCNTIYEYNSSVVLYSFLALLYFVISHCLYIYFALTFNPAPIIIICTFPKNGAHYFSGVVGCSGSRIRCKKSMKVEYWKVGKSILFWRPPKLWNCNKNYSNRRIKKFFNFKNSKKKMLNLGCSKLSCDSSSFTFLPTYSSSCV